MIREKPNGLLQKKISACFKSRYISIILLAWLTGLCLKGYAQDSTNRESAIQMQGYLKEMITVKYQGIPGSTSATNLVHQRLTLDWKPTEWLQFRTAVRTRLFYGDAVYRNPGFQKQIAESEEKINLGWAMASGTRGLLYTNIDRFYADVQVRNWNLRAGRQRINWGVTPAWNPNDLFNTYNFFDFDYEERPGSDAVKLKFVPNARSSLEAAISQTTNLPIMAVRYATNVRGYDIQLLAGSYRKQFTAGAGWAGSIGSIGFKGEWQFYGATRQKKAQSILSISADRMFKGNLYLSSGLLYDQRGLSEPPETWSSTVFTVTPQRLMPGRWTMLLSGTKQFTPLFSATLNLIYSPGIRLFILYPALQYNLKTNLDLDLIAQSFWIPSGGSTMKSHSFFLRLKWSY